MTLQWCFFSHNFLFGERGQRGLLSSALFISFTFLCLSSSLSFGLFLSEYHSFGSSPFHSFLGIAPPVFRNCTGLFTILPLSALLLSLFPHNSLGPQQFSQSHSHRLVLPLFCYPLFPCSPLTLPHFHFLHNLFCILSPLLPSPRREPWHTEQPRRGGQHKMIPLFHSISYWEITQKPEWETQQKLLSSKQFCPLLSSCPGQRVSSSVVRGMRHALGWTHCVASFLPAEVSPQSPRWDKNYTCSLKWAAEEGLIIVWVSFSARSAAFSSLLYFPSKATLGMVAQVG